MKIKEAMKKAKQTGKTQRVTEATKTEEVKVNLSIRLDLDVLNWVKDQAKRQGIPYQTYINSLLTLAKNVGSIEERLARIEKEVFKGKAGY